MRLAIAGSAALLLAACGGGDSSNNGGSGNSSTNVSASNASAEKGKSAAQNQVRAMDEGQRNAVLIRAIREGGQECQQVERSELMATSNNMPVYMVTCEGAAVYAVVIRDDGSAVVQPAMREEAK
jgi:hypothetical protein